MTHTVVPIETSHPADGQIAVKFRCCDDPTTDSWHTLGLDASTTKADVDAWIAASAATVQQLHSVRQKAADVLAALTPGS